MLLFFDIDGTLFDDSRKLPPSVLPSLEEARENGHLLFINTGRTYQPIQVVISASDGETAIIEAADKNIHLTRGLRFQYQEKSSSDSSATPTPSYTAAPTPVPTPTPRPTPVP